MIESRQVLKTQWPYFYPSVMLKDIIPLDIHSLRDYDPVYMKAWQMCDSLHRVGTSNSRQNPV